MTDSFWERSDIFGNYLLDILLNTLFYMGYSIILIKFLQSSALDMYLLLSSNQAQIIHSLMRNKITGTETDEVLCYGL